MRSRVKSGSCVVAKPRRKTASRGKRRQRTGSRITMTTGLRRPLQSMDFNLAFVPKISSRKSVDLAAQVTLGPQMLSGFLTTTFAPLKSEAKKARLISVGLGGPLRSCYRLKYANSARKKPGGYPWMWRSEIGRTPFDF